VTRTSKIIAAGFLVRAFVGQALFWISYLELPLARSLQLGHGFWFFAADGPEYLALAKAAAEEGFSGILYVGPLVPSRLFIRLVATLILAFGSVASLAILINCTAYVLTCAALVRMKTNDMLLAAIAFSPAGILFSSQLLKDTLFFFLIVLMIAVFRRWQELWRDGGSAAQFLGCALAMCASVYALSGIRWYVAAIVCASSAIFFGLITWKAARRGRALAASVMLFVLLAQCVRIGGLDMPPQIARLFTPMTAFQSEPSAVTKLVGKARRGFDRTPGATTITPGSSIDFLSGSKTPSIAARLIVGFSATFLPRFIAQPLGLVHIGGGRGFWLFAEADTLVFDLVLLYGLLYCIHKLRRGTAHASPLFVFVLLIFLITATPLIYTVNNFGTLFRLRQMLYVLAVVTPITLRVASAMSND
jgi:hypothetical protein